MYVCLCLKDSSDHILDFKYYIVYGRCIWKALCFVNDSKIKCFFKPQVRPYGGLRQKALIDRSSWRLGLSWWRCLRKFRTLWGKYDTVVRLWEFKTSSHSQFTLSVCGLWLRVWDPKFLLKLPCLPLPIMLI